MISVDLLSAVAILLRTSRYGDFPTEVLPSFVYAQAVRFEISASLLFMLSLESVQQSGGLI